MSCGGHGSTCVQEETARPHGTNKWNAQTLQREFVAATEVLSAAPRVRGCNWRIMHDPRIVTDWLLATEHVKNINQAWLTARAFARIFAKHRQCDVSEVMGSTRRVHFETLRRARIRLDAVASLVWRQWWRETPDSSISIFLYVDSSPQSRGEEMFASSFEVSDQRLPWSRELMPVLSLERHMLHARSKTLALLFQIWLLVGPSAEEMIRFLSRVRCILTDMCTERLMANMVDCLPELFQLMGAPAQGLPRRTHTFDLCLQSPGWMHQWDVILKRGFSSLSWFPSCLDGMRALVSFFRLSTNGIPTLQALEGRRSAANHS